MSALANSGTAAETARGANTARFNLLLVLPFICFFLIQLIHHEMWRDELNAWGIVVASPNPISLYQHIRYEGHPSLWYIVLWFPSRFTSSPVAMQCVQAVIGIAIYLTIAWKAPFSRLEKVLLYASYFISFEYTVMSRMYGLCLLLALIYAYRRSRYPRQVAPNAVLLALMANTDVTGLILSGALFTEYALATYHARERGDVTHKALVRAGILYTAGVLCTMLALRISPDISWRTTGRMFAFARSINHLAQTATGYIALPWRPIRGDYPAYFWNPFVSHPAHAPAILAFTLAVLLIYAWIFRRDWRLGLIIALTMGGAIVFGHLIYMGSMRHEGITFIAFLVALWLQRYRRPQFSILVLGLLVVSAGGGVAAALGQWHRPFSQGRNTVKWLRAHGLDKGALVGTRDTSVAGIAEQLQRPIYFLDCNCSDTFLLFSKRRDDYDPASIPERLKLAGQKLNARDMTFVSTDPLSPETAKRLSDLGFSADLLASFTGAEEEQENYFIYRVSAR